jgi:hypothetical protein
MTAIVYKNSTEFALGSPAALAARLRLPVPTKLRGVREAFP